MENGLPRRASLPKTAYVMCGWPLVLVFIGGALGGALGGAAFWTNTKIYKSNLPIPAKIVLNLLAGIAAFLLWAVAVQEIRNFRK
jgi:hypothetical protein